MVTLNEHIELLRKLNIPYKGTLIKYCHNLFNDHLSGDKGNELADTTGNRMTIDEFIKQVVTPQEKWAEKAMEVVQNIKEAKP